MKALVHKKALAISLRKQGFSYKDILAQVPVAKSSLSLWLKDLPLTKSEKKSLKDRLDSNISRGRIKAASVLHQNRLDREKEKLPEIISHFKKHSSEPLFQLGIGLYWAEGAKNSGTFMFTNSDVKMVEMMLLWIEKYTPYTRHFLRYRLYIHKPYEHERCEVQWSQKLKVSLETFTAISFKPTKLQVKKKEQYIGCMRIEVPKSTDLLRSIKIWTAMLVELHKKK